MTKIVGKGANRASAAANTNRHAQRTALPPRAGQVEDAKEVIALGKMTQAQLLAHAQEIGLEPPKSTPKGKLLTAILKKEQADRAEKKVDQALTNDRTADAIDAAFSQEPATSKPAAGNGATRSDAKAQAFVECTVGHGWKPDIKTDGERTTLTVRRGSEAIDLAWENGVFQHPCTYSMNGRTIQLRNASAAKQRMAMDPQKAEEETATVAARKVVRADRAAAPKRARTRALPFNDESTPKEILEALTGRKIVWINSVSGAEEVDRVPTPAEVRNRRNLPTMNEGPRGLTIDFPGQSGSRSVLISAIVTVR